MTAKDMTGVELAGVELAGDYNVDLSLDNSREISLAGLSETCHRLKHPLTTTSMEELCHFWRYLTITASLDLPNMFRTDHSIVTRIRGALGHALKNLARQNSGTLSDISAYDLLFTGLPVMFRGNPLPKPYLLRCDRLPENRLKVTLTLFGFAGLWANECCEALIQAFDRGIRLDPKFQHYRPLTLRKLDITRHEHIAYPKTGEFTTLVFTTPYLIRNGKHIRLSFSSFILSLARRVDGLARWQDLALEDNMEPLAEAALTTHMTDDFLRPARWDRHSIKTGPKILPMQGVQGQMLLKNVPDYLLPILALGQICHVGSQTALGLGHYEMLTWPCEEDQLAYTH